MGVGYLGLFDRIDHTSSSEWSSRQGESITTLQVHHTASTSDAGARALMSPGGRTVSANGLLLRDGTLVEVVPGQYRAFTSSSSFDRQSMTVETVNQSGDPTWGISEAQRRRLAKLQRDMAAAGLPTSVGRRGVGGILGHYEVPGSYATACPGPDMHLDHIAALARTSVALDDWALITESQGDEFMRFMFTRDQNGTANLWSLVNTATGETPIQTRKQDIANTWAEAWGSAKVMSVQAFLNALDAVEKTTQSAAERHEELLELIESLRAEVDADPEAAAVIPAIP